eukprot:9496364-Pyramimonas_sp.AAC.1
MYLIGFCSHHQQHAAFLAAPRPPRLLATAPRPCRSARPSATPLLAVRKIVAAAVRAYLRRRDAP